ncbi:MULTISPECIES: hypothetical protein [unclassified Novosphingobium]|uniref:hypothetical protein n=1 Tax=unclassified Novosphingobium TaxID=2644732 RepID=UPI00146E297F|nr:MULTISPECIES: hypothetical protein [unclassified Novosphingobium]NMN06796.1 hypothetical protein [Novosphingobium sp. SG919]NMN88753.1 hypothetical protein [Novosphingobium sp. SG916]
MANLRISTEAALGPLSVEVIGPRGERVGAPISLTSLRQAAVLDAVSPGDYTVVATRPSGEQLISSAKVGADGGDALIVMAGRSPREFMTEAARLGLTYAPSSADGGDFRLTSIASPRAANTASRSMSVLLGKELGVENFQLSLTEGLKSAESSSRSSDLTLRCWRFDGQWRPCDPPHALPSEDYLQVGIFDNRPQAIGLMSDDGFGPIVIAPPLAGGLDVTFLAAGVAMDANADREANPSAVRVPIAMAVPRKPGHADLLVGLNAALLPKASALLEEGRGMNPEMALLQLADKFDDSAAAVLGAVFLARFAPGRLPLRWLRNLNQLLPDVADSWVLLAWARSVQGDGDLRWDMTIAEQLRKAAACRCTYFSRTRFQLSKLSLRYGPFPRAREEEVLTPRRARTGDYLDFAADAGGLEAFWGTSPTRPGHDVSRGTSRPTGVRVALRQGRFIGIG